MPKDYKSFCMVAAHLVKNAHRYYNIEDSELKEEVISKVKQEVDSEDVPITHGNDVKHSLKQKYAMQLGDDMDIDQIGSKMLRSIRALKKQNPVQEQQDLVTKLKELVGTYREIAKVTKTPLKTVHDWCKKPQERCHKGTARAMLKREEFTNFLMQDTVTYAHPCKRYAGKQFLLDMWEQIYQKYVQQSQFHKHGILSKTTMRCYKPKYILLSGSTPLSQCSVITARTVNYFEGL